MVGAVSGKHGVDGLVACCFYYVCSGLCRLVNFLFVFVDGLRGGQMDDEGTCQSKSEEGKGQDTTT